MNEKLNPLTCDLQVGDKVEVLFNFTREIECGAICTVVDIEDERVPFFLKDDSGRDGFFTRDELRLVERNGKPIEAEPTPEKRVFVNIYQEEESGLTYISDQEHPTFETAYSHKDDCPEYVETVEIIRHKKPAPQIDFGKAGLILTDGEIVVVTTGHEEKKCFKAKVLGGYEDTFIALDNWRDITAEAQPIIEQLKQLMK